jgi:cysteine desulfurase
MEENGKIYLDYNATTPINPAVAEAMKPFLYGHFGNPSSSHWFGAQAKKAVEIARRQVADFLHCSPSEIIFTSGGTESNNMAIKGTAYALRHKGNHIITSQVEHPAVAEVCSYLERDGFSITRLPVDEYGMVHPEELEKAITPQTILISIMHANNETGTIQPVEELAAIARVHKIIFHTDAAQTVGKIPVDTKILNVDLLSLAGHKFYAPKGIGALYIRSGIKPEKILHGADHEQNLRAGTENILEIAGLGKACEIAAAGLEENKKHMKEMRDRLFTGISERIPEAKLNGHPEKRLPNTLNISFPCIEANLLLSALETKGLAVSAGAACHSESVSISPVLQAMHIPLKIAMGTIRFSTGKFTTRQQIDRAIDIISDSIGELQTDKPIANDIPGNMKSWPLTHYTQGLGCACKMKPQVLEKILADLPIPVDPTILVGSNTSDDAAVMKLSDELAAVLTVDFFTPIVDDPFSFGAIAAANAMSDVYAMGAKPLFALNIVGFPSNRLPHSILTEILKGAQSKAKEAGIHILGGHTIDDPEPKFGQCVLGLVHPGKILRNKGANPGDWIILTKPIGTGILCTAMKRGLTGPDAEKNTIASMSQLNKIAAEIISEYPVSSCTDVTGFGLSGHLHEMIGETNLNASLNANTIPLLPDASQFAASGIVPGGTKNNMEFAAGFMEWQDDVPEILKILICDAQTSGGLLFTLDEKSASRILDELRNAGYPHAAIIGKMQGDGEGKIFVK